MKRLYSYSRRSLLDRCLRQYFYEYYATDRRCPMPEECKALLRSLKGMSSCALLAGTLLHRFARLSLVRPDLSPDWLTRTALSSFDRAIAFASDPRANAYMLNNEFPPQELVEFSYTDLDGDQPADDARNSLATALDNLFRSGPVRALLGRLAGCEIHAEKRLAGLKLRDWSIGGQIDLLAVSDMEVRVVDWKLGRTEHGADSLQLHIYSWFASRFAGIGHKAVLGQRVFLGDGCVEEPRIVNAEIDEVGRARLHQDIDLMEELHDYGRTGREEVFRPCNHENLCRRCNYRAVCHGARLRSSSSATSASPPVFQATA